MNPVGKSMSEAVANTLPMIADALPDAQRRFGDVVAIVFVDLANVLIAPRAGALAELRRQRDHEVENPLRVPSSFSASIDKTHDELVEKLSGPPANGGVHVAVFGTEIRALLRLVERAGAWKCESN